VYRLCSIHLAEQQATEQFRGNKITERPLSLIFSCSFILFNFYILLLYFMYDFNNNNNNNIIIIIIIITTVTEDISSIPVPTPVRVSPERECGLFPKHHGHRMNSRCNH